MTTWSGPVGHLPSTSWSGLNCGNAGSIPKPKEGAPFVFTASPSFFRIFVFVSSMTAPAADSTSGRALISGSTLWSTGGVSAESPSKEMSAVLPETTASVFA